MADDRKRRVRIMGDDERAGLGGRRIPQYVDPEVTPPPCEPPRPESSPGFETLPPAMRQQFTMMADEISTLTAAVGKVWDARNVAPQLERLESKVDGYVRDSIESATKLREFVDPAIKGLFARIDEQTAMHQKALESIVTRIEKLDERLDEFGERFAELERSVNNLNQTVGGVAARVSIVEAIGTSHDVRIQVMERRFADQDAAAKAEQAIEVRNEKALAKRNALIKTAWGAAIAIVSAAATYLAGGCL